MTLTQDVLISINPIDDQTRVFYRHRKCDKYNIAGLLKLMNEPLRVANSGQKVIATKRSAVNISRERLNWIVVGESQRKAYKDDINVIGEKLYKYISDIFTGPTSPKKIILVRDENVVVDIKDQTTLIKLCDLESYFGEKVGLETLKFEKSVTEIATQSTSSVVSNGPSEIESKTHNMEIDSLTEDELSITQIE
ncbi:hypothetical protein EIN_399920 [Entamoeba invadens IP1]|uniref:Uncharacterized protein n=1 Tax=Entamoeba invadens IP1 TaxID=370355 RepID=A0A0A1UA83_ENTIV|nr:hypothetical protein EIN_399920 [Entamoeba invadens IP1]ELP91932.1 hypothetical protein EIN_399920 [Entamoeba invadens IP1]|eukprot:XP_004258703.1 hypothetical protein EIN_399920 [Entamoeba invadens IP1]